jgi:hypothetical protein
MDMRERAELAKRGISVMTFITINASLHEDVAIRSV